MLKASDYLCILKKQGISTMKLNFRDYFCYQQDNASVHQAKVIKNFFISSGIRTLNWPENSPDINIAEDIWRMISNLVYDGPEYQNKNELEKAINEAIFILNLSRREQIIDLYNGIMPKLIKIVCKNGNIYTKVFQKSTFFRISKTFKTFQITNFV